VIDTELCFPGGGAPDFYGLPAAIGGRRQRCDSASHSPRCALGYIAGFTRMNSILAHPFFCVGDLRVAEFE